jgi:hypothetical protein
MSFSNNIQNPDPNAKIRRWVHSPLTVDHNGVEAKILENGRVVLRKPDEKNAELYDEINIPAGLIFKLANLLTATRKVKWMSKEEVKELQLNEND